jgi:hypothetical protein
MGNEVFRKEFVGLLTMGIRVSFWHDKWVGNNLFGR